MRKSKIFAKTLGVLCSGTALLTGCDQYEAYVINAPEDLKDRIDSIAAANNPQRGDTLKLDILTPIVGAEDNTAAWWTSFSDYFTVPSNRLLHLEFDNFGTGENNWNNWNLCLAEGKRDTDGYSEYFLLRSDLYGWGNSDYDAGLIKSDYFDNLTAEDGWAQFREKMNGARVVIEVDHSKAGYAYVTAKHVAKDGTTFTCTYEQPVSATADINAFLVCDGSHFVIKDAYTVSSKILEIEDQQAESLRLEDTPTVLEMGNEDFWMNTKATVTFADGSSMPVGIDDLTLTLPDFSTTGQKTVIATYNKTKLGNLGTPVSAYYNVNVINPISRLEVTHMPEVTTYRAHGGFMDPLDVTGLEVTAYYADGTPEIMDLANLQIYLDPVIGDRQVMIVYNGTSATVSTSYPVTVEKGEFRVGVEDCSTPWWTAFSNDVVVPAGQSRTMRMRVLSDNAANWHSPCTILRKADLSEYCVVRMDNFGWGASYDGNANLVTECDWNWDEFMNNINNSVVSITVNNIGDGTAEIYYDVTYENGEKHFQVYRGLPVDKNNLQMALVTEGSCLISID